MEYFNSKGKLNICKLENIGKQGSEFFVYKYEDSVVKFFKQNYYGSHLNKEQMAMLKDVKTSRILMPSDIIFNEKGNLVGYQMPFIDGEKDILQENMGHMLDEFEIMGQDVEILTENKIAIFDAMPWNIMYNGNLYIIDPGNFHVGDMENFKKTIEPMFAERDITEILRERNYEKINNLMQKVLFKDTDLMKKYSGQTFIEGERMRRCLDYSLDVYRDCFNQNLKVCDSVQDFIERRL